MDTRQAIIKGIADFHSLNDPHDRSLSWEHCYKFFQGNPRDHDLACLHLAFYLASWGMYRGSSFLLQKDYLIHREAVKEILDQKYAKLRDISIADFSSDKGDEITKALFELLNRVKSCYNDAKTKRGGPANVTDTLATKILMGTLGCIPAYDRYFTIGLKKHNLKSSPLNGYNFSAMMDFCSKYQKEFEQAQGNVSQQRGLRYPMMKIIDAFFWIEGSGEE
ncbi:MAG: hypothetical protein K8R48_04330 [Alphaproteobacteria bacterium]|nr:hypothetical protein [Alphaproteobacteria bacterium]